MLVDDAPANLTTLSEALEAEDYLVLVAVDGESAIEQLNHITPDIVLLDAIMPGMDGFETCRRMKINERTLDIPVIFMTALSDTGDVVRGFGEGAVDYVIKPVRHAEVLARITAHMRNARRSTQARQALDASGQILIALDRLGRISWLTARAGACLGFDFGDPRSTQPTPPELPSTLRQWAMAYLRAPDAGTPPPLTVGKRDRQLAVYLSPSPSGETLLRLQEQCTRCRADDLTRSFGLTAREAEVLIWLACGKTNRDIGTILGISPRTVNKHLDHIFPKLGVETRTAAAARALAHHEGGKPAATTCIGLICDTEP